MVFDLPTLPYEFGALEPYIDKETMQIHHDKHHGAYVNNLNDVLKDQSELSQMNLEELLKNLDKVSEVIRTKVRNNAGGHFNHSFFWQIMISSAQGGGGEPKGKLAEAINSTFGDFSAFKEKFTSAAMGRFGSGWAWLVVDPSASPGQNSLIILDTPNQDSPIIEEKIPILGLDVWEHAYYLKYQNKRADYIAAWWNVVNWGEVEKRFLKEIK